MLKDLSEEERRSVERAMNSMTLREKIGQTMHRTMLVEIMLNKVTEGGS